jgi:hypothetical protein
MSLSRLLSICALTLSCGCGSYFTEAGHDLTVGAMQEATSDASKKKLTELATSAVQGARNEALGSTTQADIDKLVVSIGDSVRAQLNTLITAQLQAELRQLVVVIVNDLLGANTLHKADELREELVGAPLQKDIDALIAIEVPKITIAIEHSIQTPLAPIVNTVDQEAAKWKPIAVGFAVGSGCLLLCLVFALLIIRSHHNTIVKLLRERPGA